VDRLSRKADHHQGFVVAGMRGELAVVRIWQAHQGFVVAGVRGELAVVRIWQAMHSILTGFVDVKAHP